MSQESEVSNNNLQYLANVIFELYEHPKIKNYKPALNKKRINTNNIGGLFINDEWSKFFNRDSIEYILKTTINASVSKKVELTANGENRDKLKKGVDLLKKFIDDLSLNNRDNMYDTEITKNKSKLEILEKKYTECLERGNFEKITDYQSVALYALKFMDAASKEFRNRRANGIRNETEIEKKAQELYNLVAEKFGIVRKNKNEVTFRNDKSGFDRGNNRRNDRGNDRGYNRDGNDRGYNRDGNDRGYNRDGNDRGYNRDGNNRGYNRDGNDRQPYVPSFKRFIKNNDSGNDYIPPHLQNNSNRDENRNNRQGKEEKKEELFVSLVSESEQLEIQESKTQESSQVRQSTGVWSKPIDFSKMKEENKEDQKEEKAIVTFNVEKVKKKKEVSSSDSDEWLVDNE
jgi:hypothetical protein